MSEDVGRTSPVQGWLGYGGLISFWGVMLLFQTVVVLGMHVPYVFIYSNVCILTLLSSMFIAFILLLHISAMSYCLLHTISYILSLCLIDNKLLK